MNIKAKIIKYLPGDLHFDYDDGSFEWFDGVKLKVISPEAFEGKEIRVFHSERSEEENPWKKVGTIIEFERNNINDFENGHVFTAGLKKLIFTETYSKHQNNWQDKVLKEIEIICPTCSTKKYIKIPSKIDAKGKGIYTISIPVGIICDHSFQVYLDKHQWIRGYQKVDLEIRNIEFFESPGEGEEDKPDIRSDISRLFQKLMGQLRLVVNDKEILGAGLFTRDGRVIYSSIPQSALFNTVRELEMRTQTNMPEILKMMIELKNHQKVYAEFIELKEEKFILILYYSELVNFTLGSQIMKEFSTRVKSLVSIK